MIYKIIIVMFLLGALELNILDNCTTEKSVRTVKTVFLVLCFVILIAVVFLT